MLAASAAGCLDYELIAPGISSTPTVAGSIVLALRDSMQVDVSLTLFPGIDDNGTPFVLPDPALLLGNRTVVPVGSAEGGFLYETRFVLPQVSVDRSDIVLTLPAIPDANAGRLDVVLPLVARGTPPGIVLAPDSDLVIEFRQPEAVWDSTHSSWQFTLAGVCNFGVPFAELRGRGEPPPSITVPWSVTEAVAPDTFEACLRVVRILEVDADYRVRIGLRETLVWTIEIT